MPEYEICCVERTCREINTSEELNAFIFRASAANHCYAHTRLHGFTMKLPIRWYFYHRLSQSMEQSLPVRSDSREISHLLWNSRIHYRANKGPPMVPILSHVTLVYTLQPHVSKINFNIILWCISRSSCLFRSGFPTKFLTHLCSPHTCYISRQSYLPRFDGANSVWWIVRVMEPLIMQIRPLKMFYLWEIATQMTAILPACFDHASRSRLQGESRIRR